MTNGAIEISIALFAWSGPLHVRVDQMLFAYEANSASELSQKAFAIFAYT